MVEKLSDSKVVIRQAVLKCCSYIITNYKPSTFAYHIMRYLQHANWHVREGVLHLIAHCIISQSSSTQQLGDLTSLLTVTEDHEIALSVNPTMIGEICTQLQVEDKQKIQSINIDVLALLLNRSGEKQKTLSIMAKNLQIPANTSHLGEDSNNLTKEQQLFKGIQAREARGNLPFINEEGIIEFPSSSHGNNVSSKSGSCAQQDNELESSQCYKETFASVQKQPPSVSFMKGKRKEEEKKLQQQLVQPSFDASFLSPADKSETSCKVKQEGYNQQPLGNDRISMWLPSFTKQESKDSYEKDLTLNNRQRQKRSYENDSQSSGTTPLDDRRSAITSTTIHSSNLQSAIKGQGPISSVAKSPLFTESYNGIQSSMNYRKFGHAKDSVSETNSTYNSGQIGDRPGYTPESHASKPRTIQSTDLKPRISDQGPYLSGENEFNRNIQPLPLHKHMSQSTGVTGSGFGVNQQRGPQVTDRLKLLKSNQNFNKSHSPLAVERKVSYQPSTSEHDAINDSIAKKSIPPAAQRHQSGPIKATMPARDFMQTISNEELPQDEVNVTPTVIKNRKPPAFSKQSGSSTGASRAQSVDKTINEVQLDPNDQYQTVEQPLPNPELSVKQTLDQLKSGDWQKQFDACSTIKRLAVFHKEYLSTSSPFYIQIIKEFIKLVDSLRSQLAKNAILTIITMCENLPSRDLDAILDIVVPMLLKKAADTNIFISCSADKALVSLCNKCSDIKFFNCLQQQQNVKSNVLKVKVAMCYNALIQKLGGKFRQFRDSDKLLQSVVGFLNEGSLDVRNVAKLGLITLKNSLGSQRELENLLMRCINNDKQFQKVRQILDKGDFESINTATKYGTSMRGSSMDSRSAGPTRASNMYNNQTSTASGSDGFGNFTTSEFSMQQTGMRKQTNSTTIGSSKGFNSSAIAFKKQSFVTKPVDPQTMEEFRQILTNLQTTDWNKRLRGIDELSDFIKAYQTTISQAQPSKFIQLIDSYCKLLQDNNAKVLAQSQQSFRIILLNSNLKPLIEQNVTMIVQALNSNLSSTNASVREQGDVLFTLLEGTVDTSALIPPIVAQLNLANNRSKPQLIDRLTGLTERCEKVNIIQKYVGPLLQPSNKLQAESSHNPKLKEALHKLKLAASLAL